MPRLILFVFVVSLNERLLKVLLVGVCRGPEVC